MEDFIIFNNNQFTYDLLKKNVHFGTITNGRKGALLVNDNKNIPLVRSTTSYMYQMFTEEHYKLHEMVLNELLFNEICIKELNNAMIELYDSSYRNMGWHSDQELDLAEDSHIVIFSCYKNPVEEHDIRTLHIKSKNQKDNRFSIKLDEGTCVVFPLHVNNKYLHKISLNSRRSSINEWLGITFRRSKTFINYRSGIPYFSGTEIQLTLATDDEKREFLKHRSKENKSIGYTYPELTYTINELDIIEEAWYNLPHSY